MENRDLNSVIDGSFGIMLGWMAAITMVTGVTQACNKDEYPCSASSCATHFELRLTGNSVAEARACTVVATLPRSDNWVPASGVRSAMERRGSTVAISFVGDDGSALVSVLGSISPGIDEKSVRSVESVACYTIEGSPLSPVGAEIREVSP